MVASRSVLRLKVIADLYGFSCQKIASAPGVDYHRNSISNIWLLKQRMPKGKQPAAIQFLLSQDVPQKYAEAAFEVVDEIAEKERMRSEILGYEHKENPDLKFLSLGVIMLHRSMREHFGLVSNPFISRHEAPFQSEAFVHCHEAIDFALEEQAFLIVSGRTGCGKSVLWTHITRNLIQDDRCSVASIRRFDKGEIRIRDIYWSLLQDLATETPKGGNERVHRRVEALLVERAQLGINTVIICNEAHDLSVRALVMLKRLWEGFNDVPILGYRRAATVILLGQERLENMFRENKPETREVCQRADLETYGDLKPKEVGEYLRYRFDREGNGTFERTFDPGAVEFIAKVNLQLTPLLVNSIVSNAMKVAYQLGSEKVKAEHVGRLRH